MMGWDSQHKIFFSWHCKSHCRFVTTTHKLPSPTSLPHTHTFIHLSSCFFFPLPLCIGSGVAAEPVGTYCVGEKGQLASHSYCIQSQRKKKKKHMHNSGAFTLQIFQLRAATSAKLLYRSRRCTRARVCAGAFLPTLFHPDLHCLTIGGSSHANRSLHRLSTQTSVVLETIYTAASLNITCLIFFSPLQLGYTVI